MAETIKLFGTNVPKPVAYGGGAAILIGGMFYYRKNKANAAQQASIDQAGSSEIDPATGYPYGSAEDAAALNAQGNYQSPSQFAGGYSGSAGAAVPYGSQAPGTFTSNAQWAQYVEQYEVDNMNADGATVGNAIGKYLSGQPLTTDAMVSMVQSAIAIGGYPPVSGSNGYPPGYRTGQVPTPTTPTPKPSPAGSISGLAVKVNGTSATISWHPASGASQGYFYELSQMNHVIVNKGNTKSTSVTISGLHRGWTYNFGIQALPGGKGANTHVNIK